MPVPVEYKRASMDFEQFMVDARDISGLATTHQTDTMVQGVFQAFRRPGHHDPRSAGAAPRP